MPSKKILEFANQSIREICEDISLYGANAEAYIYLSKEGKIIDYMPVAADDGKILHIDEERVQTTLFNVLWNYLAAMHATTGAIYTRSGIWVTAARLALNMTMEDMAKELEVSTIAISSWERGRRNAKLDKLLQFAAKHDLPHDGLF